MLADLRIAITGATSALGQAVRGLLAERKVPTERLRMLEHASDEAIISEYAGQATLIGTLEPEALADRDLVFLCGSEEESRRCLLWERQAGSVWIDMSGATVARPEVPVVNLAVGGAALSGRPPLVAAPHAISYEVTTALAPIEATFGIASAEALVLRPASDFGEAGVEELHRQTVALLNFTDMPKAIFGRQMGFNVLPQSALEHLAEGSHLETRLAREIDRIFGWDRARMTLRVLAVPVFHGHAAFVHLRLRSAGAAVADVRRALADKGVTVAPPATSNPVEVVGRQEALVADITADGLDEGGFWIWIVAAEASAQAARNAVQITESVFQG